MVKLMHIDGRKMSGHSKEHFKRPRHWIYNCVCLNERRAEKASRQTVAFETHSDETGSRSAAGFLSIQITQLETQ